MASLWEMMGGGNFRDPAGKEDPALGFGDVLAQNRNTLIGLGGALMTRPAGEALQEASKYAQADQTSYNRQQLLAQHAADQRRAQSNWERTFKRSGITDAQKAAMDLGLKSGSPEHIEFMKQFYKMGDTGQITKVTNPATGEEESVIYNPRLPADQQFRPIPSSAFGTQAPAAPDPWAGVGRGGGGGGGGGSPAPAAPAAPIAGPTTALPPSFGPGRMGATTAPTGPGYLPPRQGPKAFEPAMNLRKEVTALPEVKRVSEAAPIFRSMVESHTKNTAAADLDFVYGLAKIFDPDSVVREGEMKLVGQAKSLPEDVQGWMQKVVYGGAKLPVEVRQRLLEVAQIRMGNLHSAYETRLAPYRDIARRHRINPADILPQIQAMPSFTSSSGPAAGGAGSDPDPFGIFK